MAWRCPSCPNAGDAYGSCKRVLSQTPKPISCFGSLGPTGEALEIAASLMDMGLFMEDDFSLADQEAVFPGAYIHKMFSWSCLSEVLAIVTEGVDTIRKITDYMIN